MVVRVPQGGDVSSYEGPWGTGTLNVSSSHHLRAWGLGQSEALAVDNSALSATVVVAIVGVVVESVARANEVTLVVTCRSRNTEIIAYIQALSRIQFAHV